MKFHSHLLACDKRQRDRGTAFKRLQNGASEPGGWFSHRLAFRDGIAFGAELYSPASVIYRENKILSIRRLLY